MTSETDLTDPTAVESTAVDSAAVESSASGDSAAAGDKKAGTKAGSKPRAGVPAWRTGKPDAFLAAAVDVARAAIEGIAPAEQIGQHLAAKSEGDRLVTHLFESKLAGYGGWQWYAVLTRNSRSKVVTVDELGLLPSDESILAPEWIPWAERVRPGDEQGDDETGETPAVAPRDDADEATTDTADDVTTDADGAPEDDSDDADEYDADDVDGVEDADAGDAPEGELTAAEAD